MKAWTSARFTLPLPPGHRFPIAKYFMIRDGVVARGLVAPDDVREPDRVERWALELVHSPGYIDTILDGTLGSAESRRLGFPWSEQLCERSLRTVQSTIEAAYDALDCGAGVTLAGGTHHAFPHHGEGFCVFNDVAVAIRALQRTGQVRRVVILDLDVHQGNGTARIFAADPDVFTFSIHGANNFPFNKEPSSLDLELADGTDDASYLGMLSSHLERVLDRARPELAFYLAGADPYVEDRFGRLALSFGGLRQRDAAVVEACYGRGLPIVLTMAGGYARRIEDIVTIHVNTVAELRRVYG